MDTKIIDWSLKRQEIHIKTSSNDIVTIVHIRGARARINVPAVGGRWLRLTHLQAALGMAIAMVPILEGFEDTSLRDKRTLLEGL